MGARASGLRAMLIDPFDLYKEYDADRVRTLDALVSRLGLDAVKPLKNGDEEFLPFSPSPVAFETRRCRSNKQNLPTRETLTAGDRMYPYALPSAAA